MKPFYASWTFWFGVAQIAYGIFGLLSNNLDKQVAQTMIVTGLTTIGLRIKTSTGITL